METMTERAFTSFPNLPLPAERAIYRHNTSGKLYRVSWAIRAGYVNEGRSYYSIDQVQYVGLRDGKKFGPIRTATLDKFAKAFTLVSND